MLESRVNILEQQVQILKTLLFEMLNNQAPTHEESLRISEFEQEYSDLSDDEDDYFEED